MGKRVKQRILAVCAGTVVAFAAAEITVRITLPPVDLDRLGGVGADDSEMADWANVDAFCAYRAKVGNYDDGKTVNSDGFISTPELTAKSPNTLRIAFLGGSSTACTSPVLPDEQTWPWIAAAKLDEKLPSRKVDFVNAALPGFTSFESYGRLWARVRFHSPDIVVVYHGWNEMYYFRNADAVRRWRVPSDGNWTFSGKGRVFANKIKPHWIDPWIEWSSVMCRVRRALFSEPLYDSGEVGPASGAASEWDPRAPEAFRTNLRLMLAAQEPLGLKLFVAKQATLAVEDLDPELLDRCAYSLHGFGHEAHIRAFQAIYDIIDEEVPPAQVLDLTHLSGDIRVLQDHIHLRSYGARLVGEAVAESLAEACSEPPASPR